MSSTSLVLLSSCSPSTNSEFELDRVAVKAFGDRLKSIEDSVGGRIGVYGLNTTTRQSLRRRSGERFAMCSSFKWLLGAAILNAVQDGAISLDKAVPVTEADMISWAPVTEKALERGDMTIGELCHATITTSDNPAANLLLRQLGGPNGFTRWLRGIGDTKTRLDRWEPDLNENLPGDPRDTTTPAAMGALMEQFLFTRENRPDVLMLENKNVLRQWMMETVTGKNRLQAGIGDEYDHGNKTGTSSNNQSNDVLFAIPKAHGEASSKGNIILTSYLNVPDAMSSHTDTIHQEIAETAMALLG